MKNLKDLSQNTHNRRSSEMDNYLFEKYKNSVMPHSPYVYATSYDISRDKICAYPPSQHALAHCKCVLRCCSNFPSIDLPGQESDRHNPNTSNSIQFRIYHLIARCTVYGRWSLYEKKLCFLCLQDTASVTPAKIYTRKELVIMDTSMNDFHTSFYIP